MLKRLWRGSGIPAEQRGNGRRARWRAIVLAGTLIPSLAIAPALAQDAPAQTPQAAFRYYPPAPHAPVGAPNVLLIMTDDVGFGAASTFGGPIETPTFDALARSGLRYNEFHTTAMCSPTRAALLTGRNHHAVASGAISNLSVDQEGYTSIIPKSAATVAQVLHLNGYDTAWVGKNHNTPEWETGPMGPFDHWPNGMGFDYFYGFNAAMSDQFAPMLTENRNPVDPPRNDPSYHLDRDLADHLLHWLQIQHNLRPDHPFFAYWSPGTMHSPHQALPEWIARYKGKFDMGWDRLREETFARQKRLGVIPADAVLTPRPASLPAWDSLNADQKRTYTHMMEVAAGQLAFCDNQIGRVIGWLRSSGQLDNTLVIYLQGDNGASIESFRGANNELRSLLGVEPTDAELSTDRDKHGGPEAEGNYPAAWAWATNAPFQWGKQIASHLGGLRDGLVISWPKRIHDDGQVRSQFHHVIDIAPTIYEAAGIAPPGEIDGVKQQPIDGVSMVYSFDHPSDVSTHREQYFEMLGNRSYYKDGWIASTTPPVLPWDRATTKVDPNRFGWELYDLNHDYSQSRDLAGQYPQKLAELKADFDVAARKYHVYPLQADLMGRLSADARPSLLAGRSDFTYYPGVTRYTTTSFPRVTPTWSVTAHVSIPAGGSAAGPVMVVGNMFGGMALLLDQGHPRFLYNPTGSDVARATLRGADVLTAGRHDITVRFAPLPSAGPRGAGVSLVVDGRTVASASVATLYAVRGDAYFGRPGLGELLPGEAPGPLIGANIESVEIHTK